MLKNGKIIYQGLEMFHNNVKPVINKKLIGLSQPNQDLILACKEGDLTKLKKSLDDKAEVNCKSEFERPLHIAVHHEHYQLVEELLKQKANPWYVNKDFKTPIDLTQDYKILALLFKERSFYPTEYLDHLVNRCCENYKNNPSFHDSNINLIAFYASHLASRNISELLQESQIRERYVAHLEALEASKEGVDLVGWYGRKFLTLRIHAYFELMVKLKLDLIPNSELPNLKENISLDVLRKQTLSKVRNELLLAIEASRIIKDRDICVEIEDQNKRKHLLKVLARTLVNKISALSVGNYFLLPGGYVGHALYIQFYLENNYIHIQVHNLGGGCSKHRIDPTAKNKIFPFIIGPILKDEFKHEFGENYIYKILNNYVENEYLTKNEAKRAALKAIYNHYDIQPEVEFFTNKNIPSSPEQTTGNCVVWNTLPHLHQLGVFGEWLLTNEKISIASDKRINVAKQGNYHLFWHIQSNAGKIPISNNNQPEDKLAINNSENSSANQYELAKSLQKSEKYVDAFNNYQLAANNNYSKAYTAIGRFFLQGLGHIKENKAEAYKNFIKAAKLKDVNAMMNAAQMLEFGDGIKADLPEALAWYEKAAALGDKEAIKKIEKVKHRIQQIRPI